MSIYGAVLDLITGLSLVRGKSGNFVIGQGNLEF